MPAGPRKPVKQHNGRVYWLTHDAVLGLARLCPPGRILDTQRIPRGRDRIFSTQRIFYKKNHDKSMVCFKIFRAARANLLRIS